MGEEMKEYFGRIGEDMGGYGLRFGSICFMKGWGLFGRRYGWYWG